MKKAGKAAILALIFLICNLRYVSAADSGRIQLSIPSPDPTLAGQKVTFQVIAVNSGSEVWLNGRYQIEIEIYDADKNYIMKADPVRGKVDVRPTASILAYVPLVVPNFYSGLYYYKAVLVNNRVRLAQTDFTAFTVNPLPIAQVKIPALKVSGNAAVSYETNNSDDWRDFSGSLSANLIGRLYDRSFLFNLYTISDQDDPVDIYTVLFNFYGRRVTLGIGDIQPEFSNLSVFGAGMRGMLFQYELGRHKTELLGAKLVSSEEGTSDTDGVYRRMVYALKQSADLPFNINAAVNYVQSSDIESSVDVAGPGLVPEKNSVAGGRFEWSILKSLKLLGDYQSSSYFENTKSTEAAVSDTAYRADVIFETDNLSLSSYMERINPDFYSFAAPSVDNDRQTIDASAQGAFFDFLNVSAGVNRYNDNLEDNKEYTTTQKAQNAGVSLNFPFNAQLSLNYSNSQAYADDKSFLDNSSLSMAYALNYTNRGQSAGIFMQTTEFDDKTGSSDDLKTDTVGATLGFNFRDVITGSIGVTMSTINNLIAKTEEQINSYSLSASNVIIKDRLYAQLWAYFNTDADDAETVDTDEKKVSLEFTYQLNSNTALTLGASRLCYVNEVDSTANKTQTGANLRVSYSF